MEKRIQALERQATILRFLLAAALVVGTVAAAWPQEDVIRAQRFEVVNQEGHTVALFGLRPLDATTPALMLSANGYRDDGDLGTPFSILLPRVLVAETDTSRMILGPHHLGLEADGLGDVIMRVGDEGPTLTLRDADGRSRTTVGATRLTSPSTGTTLVRSIGSVVLFDEDGKVLWMAPEKP